MRHSNIFISFTKIVSLSLAVFLFSCHTDHNPIKKDSYVKVPVKAPVKSKINEPSIAPAVQDSIQVVSDTLRTDTIQPSFQETRKLDSKYFRKSFNLHKKPFIA